jgi:hypothetical protein
MSAPFRIRRPGQGLKTVASDGDENFKFYLDRLLKMIPAEVLGLYLVGSGFIPKDQSVGLTVWAALCLAGVIAIRAYGTADTVKHERPDWIHVGISSIAFVIWVYTGGGPFAAYNLAVPWIGSLLVLGWTFFVPIFYKGPLD